jgi:hypothetical protein
VKREIYLFCDQHRSLQRIAAFGAERGLAGEPVQEFLGAMVEGRLMVTANGHFLSLAVPVEVEARTAGAEAAGAAVESCAVRN